MWGNKSETSVLIQFELIMIWDCKQFVFIFNLGKKNGTKNNTTRAIVREIRSKQWSG